MNYYVYEKHLSLPSCIQAIKILQMSIINLPRPQVISRLRPELVSLFYSMKQKLGLPTPSPELIMLMYRCNNVSIKCI
jgi:hypothetical protein